MQKVWGNIKLIKSKYAKAKEPQQRQVNIKQTVDGSFSDWSCTFHRQYEIDKQIRLPESSCTNRDRKMQNEAEQTTSTQQMEQSRLLSLCLDLQHASREV